MIGAILERLAQVAGIGFLVCVGIVFIETVVDKIFKK